jgi:hypothetical protein
MKKSILWCVLPCLLFSLPQLASAQVAFVRITDASKVDYQTSGTNVYLRNMNLFDANAQGCCYAYWIDTSTPEGKNIFTIFLESIALQQGMWVALPPGYGTGAVTFSGNW